MPHKLPSEVHELKIDEIKAIRFFSVVPLYQEELDEKLKKGAEDLEARFVAAGRSEVLDPLRASVAKTPGFFGRLFGRRG